MKEKKRSNVSILLDYAGSYKGLTFLGLFLSAVAMVMGMLPYVCIWLVIRDLVRVAPEWNSASGISGYGWMAFLFAVGGIVVYFFALMCTHLAAFRTAANIRKQGVAHLMKTHLGFFDNNGSGLLRNRLDAASADTETLLAHNLADIVGTATMFITMLVLLFAFDWRMGAACLLAAVVSIACLFSMMGGKNAGLMAEYQAAQDYMSKAGTEYVRGIPVVKVFQQTVYSFKAFEKAINDYSNKAEYYQGEICRVPQSINLTATEGAFVFMIPVALFLAPRALESGDFIEFVTDFAFYAVFSAVISTALARILFAASGMIQADTAMARIDTVMNAPLLKKTSHPVEPEDNSVDFDDVTFFYEGSDTPALEHVSFTAEPGETLALVGPSGGGKTTAAQLIPRFWDVTSGTVKVGGVDVRDMDPHVLMDQIAFVFQNDHLFKASILENVRAAKPSESGKSTCVRLAARLWDVDSGAIEVGGINIADVDPGVLLSDYSMVFQDVVLFDDTVRENIRLGKHGATDQEVYAAAEAANCLEFIDRLPQGFDTPIGENGAKLSGGERQRISIARALLKDAPIVLLDEATASLDVENETKVQNALTKLLVGKTVLVIAHRMRTVESADHIVVLSDGKVAEDGTPQELYVVESSIFRRMSDLQSASAEWSV